MNASTLRQHIPSPDWIGGTRFVGDGTLSRFAHVTRRAERGAVGLSPDNAAMREARTLYPSTVVQPAASPRLLVSGINQGKIGARITKGPWRGLPIYTLTLEERATCPRSCPVYAECYGNDMHLARRHAHGPDLEALLASELDALAARHPGGFAVRLHVLGDFYSPGYALSWGLWCLTWPALHIFGFTAWPRDSLIGAVIAHMNQRHPERWCIRFSSAGTGGGPWEATTIWREPEATHVPEGLVCPQQTGRTATCGTCGLCWAPSMAATPIVFMGHGRARRRAA